MALAGQPYGRQRCQMAKAKKKSLYRFKEFREAEKVTLEQLAADVDISVSQLSRFESGGREPRVIDLLKIADRLKVPWHEMIAQSSTGWTAVPIVSPVSAGKLVHEEPVDLDTGIAYCNVESKRAHHQRRDCRAFRARAFDDRAAARRFAAFAGRFRRRSRADRTASPSSASPIKKLAAASISRAFRSIATLPGPLAGERVVAFSFAIRQILVDG